MTVRPTPDKIAAVLRTLEEQHDRVVELDYTTGSQVGAVITAIRWAYGLSQSASTAPEWLVNLIDHALKEEDERLKAEHKEWERHYRENERAWENCNLHLTRAIPSVPYTPDETAYDGLCVLYDEGDEGELYVSNLLDSPNWGTIACEFDDAMSVTGDYHHCYLEGLDLLKEWPPNMLNYMMTLKTDIDKVAVFRFATGS